MNPQSDLHKRAPFPPIFGRGGRAEIGRFAPSMLFKEDLFADSISLVEVETIVPGVLMRLVLGHEIEGLLRMVLLLRPFATPLRHVLAAFSMAALPQSSRKRPANSLFAMKHRGSWSARMIVATVPSVSSLRPSTTSKTDIDTLGGHERATLTVPLKSHQRCVWALRWHIRTPHHLRNTY
jgi:hypothetical protein